MGKAYIFSNRTRDYEAILVVVQWFNAANQQVGSGGVVVAHDLKPGESTSGNIPLDTSTATRYVGTIQARHIPSGKIGTSQAGYPWHEEYPTHIWNWGAKMPTKDIIEMMKTEEIFPALEPSEGGGG